MSTLEELERELGPSLRSTLDAMIELPDGATPARHGATSPPTPPPRTTRRRWVATAAAALVLASVAGIALTRRAGPVDRPTTTMPTPPSVTTAPSVTWLTGDDTGALEQSNVRGVAAGPTGFVATGIASTFPSRGGVWFSPDGISWQETAVETFDMLVVSPPVATSSAFFVVAATNTDRTPESEGEGRQTLADARLYRSTDGLTWEPWGEALGELPLRLSNVGDSLTILVRSADGQAIETWWSADGIDWTRAVLPDDHADTAGQAVTIGGRHYLGAQLFIPEPGFAVWASDDGRVWEALPTPPANGLLANAAGRLVLVTDEPARATYEYDPSGEQWAELASGDTGAPPGAARVHTLGDLLVAPVGNPDGSATVWTSHSGDVEWRPDPASTLDTGNPPDMSFGGSSAVSGDRVVIFWPRLGGPGVEGMIVEVGALSADG